MRSPQVSTRVVITVSLAALLLSACSQQPPRPAVRLTPSAATSTTSVVPPPAGPVGLAATATGTRVPIYRQPGGAIVEILRNPIPAGAPLTFLVLARQRNWVQVQLAQRPNGSTGWVDAGAVTLRSLYYSLTVSTETNRLTLLRGGSVVKTFPVATGTGGTPTPHGSFYLTELLAPRNAGYGPYAFGISAFSTVLNNFGGGPGQIGLHGTDEAGSIGKAASHGCIRLHNDDITTLAKILPLGTPITIS